MSNDCCRLRGTFRGLFSSLFPDIYEQEHWGFWEALKNRQGELSEIIRNFEKLENIFWRIEWNLFLFILDRLVLWKEKCYFLLWDYFLIKLELLEIRCKIQIYLRVYWFL